jgi:hypothetical protein
MAVPLASSTALSALVVTIRLVLPDHRGRRCGPPGSRFRVSMAEILTRDHG